MSEWISRFASTNLSMMSVAVLRRSFILSSSMASECLSTTDASNCCCRSSTSFCTRGKSSSFSSSSSCSADVSSSSSSGCVHSRKLLGKAHISFRNPNSFDNSYQFFLFSLLLSPSHFLNSTHKVKVHFLISLFILHVNFLHLFCARMG